MRQKIIILTAVLLLSLTSLCLSAAKTSRPVNWQEIRKTYDLFLLKPSSRHANKLIKLIPENLSQEELESDARPETLDYIFEEGRITHFANIISKAKPAYMQLVFQMMKITDTDYSEQLDAMLGRCVASNPEGFLKIVQNATDFQLRGILGNFSGEFEDDNVKQVDELTARYRSIEKVKKKKYSQIRRRCLDIIKVFIEERETMKIQGE